MTGIRTITISRHELEKLLSSTEGHFFDGKDKRIGLAKLRVAIAAMANAEGGEVVVGLSQPDKTRPFIWHGFNNPEDANAHIQVFDKLFPLGDGIEYSFLQCEGQSGICLKIDISKSRNIVFVEDNEIYIRRGAQNLPITDPNQLDILKRNKGITSFESDCVNSAVDVITNSATVIKFMLEVVPTGEPEEWLKKNQFIVSGKPTVGGCILFADEPQAVLPKRTGLKIYRYETSAPSGSRETLDGDPLTVEGCAYDQIYEAVSRTKEIIEKVRVSGPDGLETVSYPTTALHEIITNAVLHRDYSIQDDIHIRIFDNRVEVASPGTLPGHITERNILEERFSRNAAIVRMINKFVNPPNKDVGEGLNTAFQAMREMKLKPPRIEQANGYVTVFLRHEKLASPQENILEYLRDHDTIRNKQARALCSIGSENQMKTILQKMVRSGEIEVVPGTTRYNAAYQLKR